MANPWSYDAMDVRPKMDIVLRIPDDLAERLGAAAGIERRALKVLAIEEFRVGHLTKPELRRLLGFDTRYQLDGFLKAHGEFESYSIEDLDRERRDLEELGFE